MNCQNIVEPNSSIVSLEETMNLGFIKKTIMAFVVSIFLGMSVFLFFRKFDGSGQNKNLRT